MDLFNEMAQEALDAVRVDGKFVKADVAMRLIEDLRYIEGSGTPEISAFLDRMAVRGMTAWIGDWLRRTSVETKTRKGAVIELPGHAGVRNADGDYEQIALNLMDADTLEAHVAKLTKTRDTYSTEISVLRRWLDAMRSDEALRTVGDVLEAEAS